MLQVVAHNIHGWDRRVAQALRQQDPEPLQRLAQACVDAGAQVLEINPGPLHHTPETMAFAVKVVQEAVELPLCLSTTNAAALEAGLRACRQPALVNYVDAEAERLQDFLPLAARHQAQVILYTAQRGVVAIDAQECLELASILVGAANEAGIPNERLLLDPGIMHVGSEVGQDHAAASLAVVRALPTLFDPPVRSCVWVGNISAGTPRRLRPAINSVFLALMAGAGLDMAFVDVLNRETRRTLRLIAAMADERIFSDADAELR